MITTAMGVASLLVLSTGALVVAYGYHRQRDAVVRTLLLVLYGATAITVAEDVCVRQFASPWIREEFFWSIGIQLFLLGCGWVIVAVLLLLEPLVSGRAPREDG